MKEFIKNHNIHKRILDSQKGAILPMVLAAGFLLVGVSYYVMNLDEEVEKENLRLKFKTEVEQIKNHVNFILANPKYCMLTLTNPSLLDETNRNMNPNRIVSAIDEVTDPDNPTATAWTYLTESNGDGAKGYYESRVKIRSFRLESSPAENAVDKYKREQLWIEIVNKGLLKGQSGPETYLKKVPIYVEWAPPRDTGATFDPSLDTEGGLPPSPGTEDPLTAGDQWRIVNCRAVSNTDDQLWSLGDRASAYYGKTITDPATETPVRVGINVMPPEDNSDARFDSELVIGDPDVEGTGNAIVSDYTISNSFTYHSDLKLKKNIKSLSNALKIVQSLRGVGFSWVEDNRKDFGFIAQEVEDELPEIVKTNKSTGLKKVDYAKIIPFLVKVFQDQHKKIQQLKKRIKRIQR